MPFEDTIDPGDFRSWTLDTWHFAPESAKRVGHPAPFPVELPRRVIELNTYKGDCVLDPFMGSGQTAIACLETGRHYVGIDVDQSYVDLAQARRVAGHELAGSAAPRNNAAPPKQKSGKTMAAKAQVRKTRTDARRRLRLLF